MLVDQEILIPLIAVGLLGFLLWSSKNHVCKVQNSATLQVRDGLPTLMIIAILSILFPLYATLIWLTYEGVVLMCIRKEAIEEDKLQERQHRLERLRRAKEPASK